MKFSMISAAVVGALGTLGSTSTFALNPAATAAATTAGEYLVVAGSSAARDAFLIEMAQECAPGTLDEYGVNAAGTGASQPNAWASGYNGPDFRAYSCTIEPYASLDAGFKGAGGSVVPNTSTLPGKNFVVYYRSEGGSFYGYAPLAKGLPTKRLLVNTSCTLDTTASDNNNAITSLINGTGVAAGLYLCPITAWNLAADTGAGNIVNDNVMLAITDEEPATVVSGTAIPEVYTGENFPSGVWFGAQPTQAQINATSINTVFGQIFMAYASTVGGSAGVNDVSRQTLQSIFTGTYKTWSQVPGGGAGNITLCRRDIGSGTQAGASIYANDFVCGGNSLVPAGQFVTASVPPLTVKINNTTSDMDSCVGSAAGNAIGFRGLKNSAPGGTKILTVNGVVPNQTNVANGDYEWWFEAAYSTGANFAGLGADVKDMANGLIAFGQDNTSNIQAWLNKGLKSAGGDAIIYIPGAGANTGNPPVLPVAAYPGATINLGTRSGNSCTQITTGNN